MRDCFYFACSEEFLLLLRVRAVDLAKKAKLRGASRDFYFTCQGRVFYSEELLPTSHSRILCLKSKLCGIQ